MKKLLHLCVALSLVFVFGTTCYADSYETEPNNDKAQADALVSGSPIIGQISSKTDKDWFYVCTSDADVINVSFYKEYYSGQSSWSISIEDAAGNLLSKIIHYGYHKDEETSTSFSAVTEPGIYYVVVEPNTNYKYGGDGNYTLTTSVSNPGECPAEPFQYDLIGIWQVVGQGYYFSLYISDSTVIIITFVPGQGEGYMTGNISGNTGTIAYASDLSQFNATFTATSPTTGTLTVNTCVPFSGEYCLLPAGETVNVKKIF